MRMHRDPAVAETVRCSNPDADTLAISGALTFATAARALHEGSRALTHGACSRLDLKDITRADSAGLACVLALLAQASRNKQRLDVIDPPEGLRALAEVCDADGLICHHP
ncbi:MAG TPA: STAS domain-containing protein [Rhodanobacteraceae bacterium]|nr:STAS domain-containing protein [Rhodanobacteraceae bacterium]